MISLKRIIKSGWNNFSRNIGLNLAAIFIMVMVIFMISFIYFLNPVSDVLIADVEKKVDISVYFNEGTLEENIYEVKAEIAKIPQVKEVEYISKEEAFDIFIEAHKDDPVLMESLTEVGYNPFLASLNVKAQETSQYEQVASFLETGPFKDLINKVDYHQRKPVIEKVYSFTSGIKRIGVILGLFFGLIAVLIAFNTVRITIHNSNEEISIMRLVGASNWFVRGPFLVQGIIVGIIAALISLLVFFGASWAIDGKLKTIISNISIFQIFLSNIFVLLLIQLATGIGLGIASSLVAVRRYLKI